MKLILSLITLVAGSMIVESGIVIVGTTIMVIGGVLSFTFLFEYLVAKGWR